MGEITLQAKDVVSAKLGRCFVTIGENRYLLMQTKNIEITYEKEKSKIAILGRITQGNKANGGSISGTMTIYHNTDIFTDLILQYQKTGQDLYFDMEITNDDPTSEAGARTIVINGCNIDSLQIATIDADGESLEQEIEFTAEDFDIPQAFKLLSGMII